MPRVTAAPSTQSSSSASFSPSSRPLAGTAHNALGRNGLVPGVLSQSPHQNQPGVRYQGTERGRAAGTDVPGSCRHRPLWALCFLPQESLTDERA